MRESSIMTVIAYILFVVLLTVLYTNTFVAGEIASTPVRRQQLMFNDPYTQGLADASDKVNIQLYYESLCPDCRNFDSKQFKNVVVKLSKYLNIRTYPYGNAETFQHNGKYKFKCQHGPKECYGNKLHACALSIIKNQTEALLFNSCMMDYSQDDNGSDDAAADKCAVNMKINCDNIKACAKSERGSRLLKYYGDESKKANFQYVPYILVNGKENDGSNFMSDVCGAYANPPPPCAQIV